MVHSFRNDHHNTGQSPYRIQVDSRGTNEIQKVYLGGLIWGTPVCDRNENVYIGSTNKYFYCIKSSMEIAWKYRITNRADSLIDSAATLSPDEMQVVVPGGDGCLHALDTRNGQLKWIFRANGASDEMHASGVIVNSFEGNAAYSKCGKYVFAGCDNTYFYCIDAISGTEIWKYKTDMMIWTVACIVDDNVIFGSLDSHLYIVDIQSGKLVNKLKTNGEIKASPCFFNNQIIVCNSAGFVNSLVVNNQSGQPTWSTKLGAEIYSSPAVKDNKIVVATMGGRVFCLDSEDGRIIWNTSIQEYTTSSPFISVDNVVVIGNSKGRLISIDLFDGTILGVVHVSQDNRNINSSPIHMETRVVVGSYDGFMYFIPSNLLIMMNDNMSTIDPDRMHMTHLELVSQPDALIHSIRLNATTPSASINKNSLSIKNEDGSPLNYTVQLSPDGLFINLIPSDIYLLDNIERSIKITGTFYQSTTWIKDRFNFSDDGSFSEIILLPASPVIDEDLFVKHETVAGGGTPRDIFQMVVSQPTILDTYIPAAMDGQGFIMHIVSIDRDASTFSALFIPAIPDIFQASEVLAEPSKVISLQGVYRGNIIHMKSSTPFTFSAMGGTISFSEFNLFGVVDAEGLILFNFYAKASCLKIKGNGESYEFSTEIINKLCDYKLNIQAIGTARTRKHVEMPLSIGDSKKRLVVEYNLTSNAVTAQMSSTYKAIPKDNQCIYIDGVLVDKCESSPIPQISIASTDAMFVRNAFGPFIQFCCRANIHPNVITISSLVTTAFMVYCHRYGLKVLVPLLIMYKWFADAVDGPVARACGKSSNIGGFLDSLADYIFAACAYIVIVNTLFPKRNILIVGIEGFLVAAIPWAIIVAVNGTSALYSHADFKNSHSVINSLIWYATENTFIMLIMLAIVYIVLNKK
jgi:outer membrane protein assembly factor BamB/phosphatidylglycerophosphate synthase